MNKYPPERTRGLLPMPRLPEGEVTEAMRVRGPADVVKWAAGLTPAQRGAIFSAAHAAQHAPQPPSAPSSTPAPASPARPGPPPRRRVPSKS